MSLSIISLEILEYDLIHYSSHNWNNLFYFLLFLNFT